MLRIWCVLAVAGLVIGATDGVAQPPGPGRGFEKKEFEKKDFDRIDGPRKDADRQPGDRVQMLERELAELRARTAELEGQLKKARGGAEQDRPGQPPMARGPGAPGGPGGFGAGGTGGRGGFGPGGAGGPGGPGAGGPGGFPPQGGFGGNRPGGGLPLEQMGPEQIKEMIVRLQKALDEKTRGGDRPTKNPGERPLKSGADKVKPGGSDKAGPSQDEILKRLDKLTQELDELRRSIKK